ncbi:MAG TPA: primosomal protein N' [Candidatus Latescibacteria bacterium]|nr:primosomal protein N' [Candidatus Latescibacterota bacterium]
MYVQVALPIPVDRTFTYRVPEGWEARPGHRVLVPFRGKARTGFVVGASDEAPEGDTLPLLDLLDSEPLLPSDLLDLTRWVGEYYLCSWGEAIKAAVPPGLFRESHREVCLKEADPETLAKTLEPKAPLQARIVRALSQGPVMLSRLVRNLGRDRVFASIYELARKGYVDVVQKLEGPRVRVVRLHTVRLKVPPEEVEDQIGELERRAPRQAECLKVLWERGGEVRLSELEGKWRIGRDAVRRLEGKGLVEVLEEEVVRDPFAEVEGEPPLRTPLTPHQEEALRTVEEALEGGFYRTVLLWGVTGSGKTRVYLEAIDKALELGKGAIVLVPEISLTPQTVRRFRGWFGDQVAVLHSGLSEGERYDAWRMLREGKRRIVIGARSAVFAPVPDLGLIVVDEEHETTYKQYDAAPRYHARDVAVMRMKMSGGVAVLGSATPSLESYYNAIEGKFHLVKLPERIMGRPLPEVRVVDMREEHKAGRWPFSDVLLQGIGERLGRGEKVILLQNRRGYAAFVQCPDCGHTFRCPHCQVTLTYHAAGRSVVCHYCGFRRSAPSLCPQCGGMHLRMRGVGTERVEEALKRAFPEAKVVRMDLDTTGRKGAHWRLLDRFGGEGDVLLGTQMVAKGLDYPEVTLVGVVSADVALSLPDFRAGEHTFQLLAQVAGRTGRGDIPGKVVIQTYSPDDRAIRFARKHDFEGYAVEELRDREALGYPPFRRLILVCFRGRKEGQVQEVARGYGEALRGWEGVEVLGPVEAPLGRLRGYFRWHLLLKGDHRAIHRAWVEVDRKLRPEARRKEVLVAPDVDPVGML